MSHATPEETKKYTERFPAFLKAGHYRDFMGLPVSSLGLGTYLGSQNANDDPLYVEAIQTALLSGVNLIDSAINYRCMRSERAIGEALRQLIKEGKISREEVVICTKGGFIPFDGEPPPNPEQYFQQEYIQPGFCEPKDIAAGCHCMTSAYLRNQVERSLKNLALDCIDLYHVHNPETQLDEVDRPEFLKRLEKAFAELEKLVAEGKIRAYGTATWNGYRVPDSSPEYLLLEEILAVAEKAGGTNHHFKAVQLPYNLGMTEAYGSPNQTIGGEKLSLLEAARRNGIAVFTSASILQSKLSRNLPAIVTENFPGLATDAQRAIQFTRSTPGVTAALVGMKRKAHVTENLGVALTPPAPEENVERLFR
jgi:aryl-alcohol dehydrogenase-like predicted oxidoreductase